MSSLAKTEATHARNILGVHIDIRDGESIIRLLDEHLASGRPLQVSYANAHTLNVAYRQAEVRSILNQGLVLNDGIGVELASRLLYGSGYPENLNGTDFTPRFLSSSKQSLRVFLLGALPGVAEETMRHWQQMIPGVEFVGQHHGHFSPESTAFICEGIRASGANLLLVAMGNPLQEQWVYTHQKETGVILAFGVGALFDFVSKRVPRAPLWLRKLRSEWVYRLLIEPKRMFRRYVIGNGLFLWRVVNQKFGRRSL